MVNSSCAMMDRYSLCSSAHCTFLMRALAVPLGCIHTIVLKYMASQIETWILIYPLPWATSLCNHNKLQLLGFFVGSHVPSQEALFWGTACGGSFCVWCYTSCHIHRLLHVVFVLVGSLLTLLCSELWVCKGPSTEDVVLLNITHIPSMPDVTLAHL